MESMIRLMLSWRRWHSSLALENVFWGDKVPSSELLATDMTNTRGETDFLTTFDGTVPTDKCQSSGTVDPWEAA